MLQHVEHGDSGAAFRREGRFRQPPAHGGHAGVGSGHTRGVDGEIHPGELVLAIRAALLEHAEKQAAAAADIDDQTVFSALFYGAFDEPEVIAEHEPAVGFFQALRAGFASGEPIIGGIVSTQLGGDWRRIEADQAAALAFDDEEVFGSSGVQTVRGGKKRADLAGAASGTGGVDFVGAFGFARPRPYAPFWDSSRREMRCESKSPRIWRGVKRCTGRKARRFRNIVGISGNADQVPRSRARAAVSFPAVPW